MRACFTVDMEPDCPPYLSGWRGVDEGAPKLFELLRRWAIPSTLFVTGALVRRDPDRVRAWAADGHELGCHGDAHVRFSTMAPQAAFDDLRRATDALSALGTVRSFRAPNLDLPAPMLPVLRELGYALDSSEGRHKHFRARVRREAGLLRVPASTTSSLLRLPPWLVAPILKRLPSPLVMFIHPWELVDLRRERLRFDCRARTGDTAVAALDGLFARLKEAGYSFCRMDALLQTS
jgi:peptidoglycan/xylan/chitin deacetylase (PgdA/CDA1 family)